MTAAVVLDRRTLLVTGLSAAGGLSIGAALPAKAASPAGADAPSPREVNAWLVIEPDNTVLVRLGHAEMGQGTSTALVMLVAEELQCDWTKVRCEHASANRNVREKNVYKAMNTVGSQGLRSSVQTMQQVGASARERLIVVAARRWDVPAGECEAANGQVVHKATQRTATFGALAGEAAAVTLATEPAIKSPDQFKLVGKATARLDTAPKLDGSAMYGIDVKRPDMVYAAVVTCPEFGAKLGSVDESAIAGRRGIVQVVKLDDAVAVVADRYWRAKSALDKLKIAWAPGPNAKVDSAQLDKAYRDALDGPMVEARKTGDIAAGLATPGAKVIEATYEVPYLAHACMEPMNATVHLQADRLDIWVGTQSPMVVLNAAAAAAGLKPEQVYVHNQFLGGGFGRRSIQEEVLHGIAISKAVNKPVKVIWSREQDMRRDQYRPQAAIRFKAALDQGGKCQAFDTRIVVGSLLRARGAPVANGLEPMATEGIASMQYQIPNIQVGVMLKNAHVPVGFWRSVGASQNTFFLESFIDELATEAGQDPYQFRRAMLQHRPDYLGVLDMMAAKSGWGEPLPPGRGRGMAIIETYGSIAGQVAEVTVDKDGKVTVDRIVAVMDCYHAANPNTIEQQIEGGVVWGLSAALYGEATVKDGGVVQSNFNNYRVLRIGETPKIETYLSLSGGTKWGGIGEPSVAPVAPAVCNAIFAVTGKRVRRLPLKNIDLTRA